MHSGVDLADGKMQWSYGLTYQSATPLEVEYLDAETDEVLGRETVPAMPTERWVEIHPPENRLFRYRVRAIGEPFKFYAAGEHHETP